MTGFEFRLRTLLEVREAERDACRTQLAELLTADERLRQQRREVERALQNQLRDRRDALALGRMNLGELQAGSDFEHSLRCQAEALAVRETSLGQLIAQQQAALVEAQRQVRVLENLRERDWQQFQAQQRAVEGRASDEAAARQRRAG